MRAKLIGSVPYHGGRVLVSTANDDASRNLLLLAAKTNNAMRSGLCQEFRVVAKLQFFKDILRQGKSHLCNKEVRSCELARHIALM
jgi:hypothetical protein